MQMLVRRMLLKIAISGVLLCYFAPQYACAGFMIQAKDHTLIRARSFNFVKEIYSRITAVPRGYRYTSQPHGLQWTVKYGFVAADGASPVSHVIDGINEQGLSCGLFPFKEFASYAGASDKNAKQTLAPWELGAWLLSSFASVDEVREHLDDIAVLPANHSSDNENSALHYFVVDQTGKSIVIEPLGGKLKIFEDPFGAIADDPPFDWHVINLRCHVNLLSQDTKKQLSRIPYAKLKLSRLKSMGKICLEGIPCDFGSPSRFVRAVTYPSWAQPVAHVDQAILQAIHIMNLFFVTKGIVSQTNKDSKEFMYTQWETFTDITNLRYYYRTYNNMNIRVVDLNNLTFDGDKILSYPMEEPMIYEDITTQFK